MHERSLVSVKVEPRSTFCLSSALYILPLFYLRDWNLRALTYVAKNASVEINLKTAVKDTKGAFHWDDPDQDQWPVIWGHSYHNASKEPTNPL